MRYAAKNRPRSPALDVGFARKPEIANGLRNFRAPTPPGTAVLLHEADLRPGGRFRIDGDYGGAITRLEGVYEEVVELERVVTVGSFARDGVRLTDTRRVVTFEDDGNKTKITLHQAFYNVTPEGADSAAGARHGMPQLFDRLEEHLRRQ